MSDVGDAQSDDGAAARPGESGRSRSGRLAPLVALGVALVCAGLFFVLAGADAGDKESAATPLMGRPAPEALGELADGAEFDLARRKGSWVVLNFFDADCVPCRQEHPALVGFDDGQQSLDDGAELITVVYGDDPEGVRRFFDENGGGWPVVYDDDGSISAAFAVNLVPETWIIDPDGYVRWRTISTVTTDGLSQVVDDLQRRRG